MAYTPSAQASSTNSGGSSASAPQRQLRTRPVDGAKPLFVVRSAQDVEALAEEEGIHLDAVALGFLPSGEFVSEESDMSTPRRSRHQAIAVPPIAADSRVVQSEDFVQPEHYIRTECHRDSVSGLRLSDGSLVHFDMLLEDEQFVDALNKRLNSNNLATPRPVFVPADPAAASALGNAASPASTAAAASGFSLRTESTNASGASASEAGAAAEPPQAAAPSSGPCRLVLSPACLVNRSLFLSDVAFVKLVDALEKEAHSRGGSEASVSSDDAIKLALHDLGLGLHALVVRQVHAHWQARRQRLQKPLLRHLWPPPSPADTSPLAVFRPRVGREKMTLRKQKRVGRDAIIRAEKLLDDLRLVEKLLRRMRTRDEKKEHMLELRDRIRGAASRRADRRQERRLALAGRSEAAAAASREAARPEVGAASGAASASASASLVMGGRPLLPGGGAGAESGGRQGRRQAKRDRSGRFLPLFAPYMVSSWSMRARSESATTFAQGRATATSSGRDRREERESKGEHGGWCLGVCIADPRPWRAYPALCIGTSPQPPALLPPSTPSLLASLSPAPLFENKGAGPEGVPGGEGVASALASTGASASATAAACAVSAAASASGGAVQPSSSSRVSPPTPPVRYVVLQRRGRGGRLWLDRIKVAPPAAPRAEDEERAESDAFLHSSSSPVPGANANANAALPFGGGGKRRPQTAAAATAPEFPSVKTEGREEPSPSLGNAAFAPYGRAATGRGEARAVARRRAFCKRTETADSFEPPFASAAGVDDPANCGGFPLLSVHNHLRIQQRLLSQARRGALAESPGVAAVDGAEEEGTAEGFSDREKMREEIRKEAAAVRLRTFHTLPSASEAEAAVGCLHDWLALALQPDAWMRPASAARAEFQEGKESSQNAAETRAVSAAACATTAAGGEGSPW